MGSQPYHCHTENIKDERMIAEQSIIEERIHRELAVQELEEECRKIRQQIDNINNIQTGE